MVTASFKPHPDGFSYANELVEFVHGEFGFCLGGACYPEKHIEAASADLDLHNLKRKVESGCEFLITQLFFDNEDYFNFVERARDAGIDVPIVPGIMPITNVSQIERFTKMCGAAIPGELDERLQRFKDDPQTIVGLVSVMDTRPMQPNLWTRPILGVFANRVALELERQRAEEKLRESEAFMRLTLENAPIGIASTDLEGRLLDERFALGVGRFLGAVVRFDGATSGLGVSPSFDFLDDLDSLLAFLASVRSRRA